MKVNEQCGCVSTGRDLKPPIIVNLLIIIGAVLYFAFPVPYFIEIHSNYSPLIFGILLVSLMFVFFFSAMCTDPGIIPRAKKPLFHPEIPSNQLRMRVPQTTNLMSSKGITSLRYCETCQIFKPPKCEHCYICDNCILEYDHHW